MPKIEFDRYYKHPELTELLQAYAAEYPGLVSVSSIGKSHEGRDIWMVTVTNTATGPASDKPAFWCDANIHASELSASTAVLHLLNKLVTKYGDDADITRALDTRAFYLVPRLNPDGAEWAMEVPPRLIRSSTRPYPYDEEDHYGLERKDLDGDGRILSMRIPDPNGAWKISPEEPRLMQRRDATDFGGQYYRVVPEGEMLNWDGIQIRGHKIKEGLDLNRNFPSAWRIESEQYGAGPYPTSEPEVESAVRTISSLGNICGAITFHTYSGVFLRPPSRMPDDDIPAEDLWLYKDFGAKIKDLTGYPAISNFHEFKYHPKEVITGVFDDWAYEHMGIFAWTCEIWSAQRHAGITEYKYIEWFRDHPFEHDIMMLKWADENLDGKGYIDWYDFDHPQFGKVQIGGWDAFYSFRNPPPNYLEKEIAPLGDAAIFQALASPKLEHRDLLVEKLATGWKLRWVVANTGFLPTTVTKIAADKKIVRGVVGEISKAGASDASFLASGLLRQEKGQLTGWSHVAKGGWGWSSNDTTDLAVFEWLITEPGEYHLEAKHARAGRVTQVVTLD